MSTFAERFDLFFNAHCDYNSYREARGYYCDNGVTRWEPRSEVEVEPEKRFGAGTTTKGETDDYDFQGLRGVLEKLGWELMFPALDFL